MATSGIVGAVGALWRFPVKSMRGERLEQAELTESSLVGDRAHALIDADTGKVVSAKSVKLFPGLFGCRAAFVEPPRSGGELPSVRIALPDGTSVTSDSSEVDCVLSAYFRRDVTLARAAPDDFTIDQYHPTSRISTQQATEKRWSNRSSARLSLLKPVLLPPCPSVRSSTCFRCPS